MRSAHRIAAHDDLRVALHVDLVSRGILQAAGRHVIEHALFDGGLVRAGQHRDTRALARALAAPFLPRQVVLMRPAGEAGARVADLAPYTRGQSALGGRATAYVCRDFACELPTTDASRMLDLLGVSGASLSE